MSVQKKLVLAAAVVAVVAGLALVRHYNASGMLGSAVGGSSPDLASKMCGVLADKAYSTLESKHLTPYYAVDVNNPRQGTQTRATLYIDFDALLRHMISKSVDASLVCSETWKYYAPQPEGSTDTSKVTDTCKTLWDKANAGWKGLVVDMQDATMSMNASLFADSKMDSAGQVDLFFGAVKGAADEAKKNCQSLCKQDDWFNKNVSSKACDNNNVYTKDKNHSQARFDSATLGLCMNVLGYPPMSEYIDISKLRYSRKLSVNPAAINSVSFRALAGDAMPSIVKDVVVPAPMVEFGPTGSVLNDGFTCVYDDVFASFAKTDATCGTVVSTLSSMMNSLLDCSIDAGMGGAKSKEDMKALVMPCVEERSAAGWVPPKANVYAEPLTQLIASVLAAEGVAGFQQKKTSGDGLLLVGTTQPMSVKVVEKQVASSPCGGTRTISGYAIELQGQAQCEVNHPPTIDAIGVPAQAPAGAPVSIGLQLGDFDHVDTYEWWWIGPEYLDADARDAKRHALATGSGRGKRDTCLKPVAAVTMGSAAGTYKLLVEVVDARGKSATRSFYVKTPANCGAYADGESWMQGACTSPKNCQDCACENGKTVCTSLDEGWEEPMTEPLDMTF